MHVRMLRNRDICLELHLLSHGNAEFWESRDVEKCVGNHYVKVSTWNSGDVGV